MTEHNNRSSDNSMVTKLATDPGVTFVVRLLMVSLIPISIVFGTRLVNQLDANTNALINVASTQAVTSRVLDDIVRRVDRLEERDRMNRTR